MNVKTHERPLHDYLGEVSEHREVRRGAPVPQGTHEIAGGINFALFSRHASRVRLELFDRLTDAVPKKSLTSALRTTARVTCGTSGFADLGRGSSMLTA